MVIEIRIVVALGTGSLSRMTIRGTKEKFWGDEYVLYLDLGGGYKGMYIFQNSSNFMLKMCAFYFTYIVTQIFIKYKNLQREKILQKTPCCRKKSKFLNMIWPIFNVLWLIPYHSTLPPTTCSVTCISKNCYSLFSKPLNTMLSLPRILFQFPIYH